MVFVLMGACISAILRRSSQITSTCICVHNTLRNNIWQCIEIYIEMLFVEVFEGTITNGNLFGIFNFVVIQIKLWKSLNQQSSFNVFLNRKGFDTMHRSRRVPLSLLKQVAEVTRLPSNGGTLDAGVTLDITKLSIKTNYNGFNECRSELFFLMVF